MKKNENAKEFIAIGASLAAHCQPRLTFHVDKAKKLGIREDEINEAIAVGRMIQKGALVAMDRFAESVIVGPENKSSPCCDHDAGQPAEQVDYVCVCRNYRNAKFIYAHISM